MTTRTWDNYLLIDVVEFGSAAHKNRGRFSGAKIHRIISEYIIGLVDDSVSRGKVGTFGHRFLMNDRKPLLFACRPACGCTHGQNAARPIAGKTAADVTCEKCSKSS